MAGKCSSIKNITEQISIIEKIREVDGLVIQKYLPASIRTDLPVLYKNPSGKEDLSERDILYKVLFDMKKDINDLKKVVVDILQNSEDNANIQDTNSRIIKQLYQEIDDSSDELSKIEIHERVADGQENEPIHHSEVLEESLSLQDKEIDMIKRALEKHNGKRKNAALELGISERTLYRKIKEYNIK